MSSDQSESAIFGKLLGRKELPFRDFIELVLYDPENGYYATRRRPIGKQADYITSPTLSPVFAFALGRLCREFVSRAGDEVSTIVDVGCGDGTLIRALRRESGEIARFFGVDRYLERVESNQKPETRNQNAGSGLRFAAGEGDAGSGSDGAEGSGLRSAVPEGSDGAEGSGLRSAVPEGDAGSGLRFAVPGEDDPAAAGRRRARRRDAGPPLGDAGSGLRPAPEEDDPAAGRRRARRRDAGPPTFTTSLESIPLDGAHCIISNELFDALPFARLVQRREGLHELWVDATPEGLDWSERPAPRGYEAYFASRGIHLEEGQFADISLEWETKYAALCSIVTRGLVVTFDYGFPQSKLFHPRARRYGTAAAYAGHKVSRDLLASPGEQDLTAHINFDDLIRAGERAGFETLFFDRQSKFLLTLGITEHELFAPSTELRVDSLQQGVSLLDERDLARQLVLPDGIGHDIRVLVQGREVGHGWSFERSLF